MALNQRQMKCAELMALFPERTQESIAEEVGVTSKTVWVWKNEYPEFMEYYHTVCRDRFKELESLAIQKLESNVKKGNQRAIEYTLDYLGYKAKTEVKAEVDTEISVVVE